MDHRILGQKRSRSRSRSPPPWHRQTKSLRREARPQRERDFQNRQGHTRMDREERDWVAKEDDFVLKQAKKKAQIRVREGRAKPIDWLAVVVAIVELEKDVLEDDGSEADLDMVDPADVVEELGLDDLRALLQDIEHYAVLEKSRDNLRFWKSLKSITSDRIRRLAPSNRNSRSVASVSDDVARLLGPKSKQQLEVLEGQVHAKLKSDDDIDVEYWEHLLDSIGLYKAKAELTAIYKNVLGARTDRLKREQGTAVATTQANLDPESRSAAVDVSSDNHQAGPGSESTRPDVVLTGIAADRQRTQRGGYVPASLRRPVDDEYGKDSRVAPGHASQTTNSMYDTEAARGVEDDEEIFAAEAELPAASTKNWAGSYKPRKPKYFNRVQMGYEWNKYNQTHYDQDNPPPKVVQGYKFNIFYPDLIDKTKAPTYKIQREHGRKRGQSFAPAGEEDTCIIRFISGPPYEDLAFRIVDKEWDYSARRERGFKSSFDKGILQLHFQFKKVYYRK